MPYWHRAEHFAASLAAYRKLYSHLDLEFSIADDGSYPALEAPGCVVTQLPLKPVALNPCTPINTAIRASIGDIIVLTNPEVLHTENVLDGMLKTLQGPKDYVTVACQNEDGSWLAGPGVDYGSGGRWPVPPNSHFHFCAMFRRSLFDEVGGFDEEYRFGQSGDDADWLWRVYSAGAVFKLAPGVVLHARGERTQWFGDLETNANLLFQKWGHLYDFRWSDAACAARMRLGWDGGRSAGTDCGPGSSPAGTAAIREWLPKIIDEYRINSICDAGAGDMCWIHDAVPANVRYLPFDLVPRSPSVMKLDIAKTAMPKCSAILCRHVLIHMDPPRVKQALRRFHQSARYLIASQYPGGNAFDPDKYFNHTDLTAPPYGLGEPLATEPDAPGSYIAIWDLSKADLC